MIQRSRQAIGYGDDSLLTTCHINRTVAPQDINESTIRDAVLENLRDFRVLSKVNVKHGLYIHRIHGEIVPHASHPFNKYDWIRENKFIFESIGKWLTSEKSRLIIAPRKQVYLGFEDDQAALNEVAYLRYYVKLLETMKLDATNKILITLGRYSPSTGSVETFIQNFFRLNKKYHKYVALTNEPGNHRIGESLEVAEILQIPFVLSHTIEEDVLELSDVLDRYLRRINRTYRYEDGNPIIQIKEKVCDPSEEFYKLIKYDTLKKMDHRLIRDNISILYDSDFRDIAAIKMTNCFAQERGVFLKETCIKEWQRYRYLVMAHDPDAFVAMQQFMEKPSSFDDFYHLIEAAMSRFKQLPNDLFAAEELLTDMKGSIGRGAYEKGMSLLQERDMTGFKRYCRQLAYEKDLEDFIANYYLYLN